MSAPATDEPEDGGGEEDGQTKIALSEAAQARVVEMEAQVRKAQEAMEQAKVDAEVAKSQAVSAPATPFGGWGGGRVFSLLAPLFFV